LARGRYRAVLVVLVGCAALVLGSLWGRRGGTVEMRVLRQGPHRRQLLTLVTLAVATYYVATIGIDNSSVAGVQLCVLAATVALTDRSYVTGVHRLL
jgi:hypothetical protein